MSIEQKSKILASDMVNSLNEKAPTSHASTSNTYGVGSGNNYGHVKLSDSTSSTSTANDGVAASPKAVSSGLDVLMDDIITAANNAGYGSNSNIVQQLHQKIDTKADKVDINGKGVVYSVNNTNADSNGNVMLNTFTEEVTMRDNIVMEPLTGEGGQFIFKAALDDMTSGDILFDNVWGTFRIIGLPSKDGVTRPNIGTDFLWNSYVNQFVVGGKHIVRSVNGTLADETGNVTINATPSTVYGTIGSSVASNGTSLTLPSGGQWFVWNVQGGRDKYYGSYSSGSGANTESHNFSATDEFGVGTASGTSGSGFVSGGSTFSGGTTVYAKIKANTNPSTYSYSNSGKLVAVRIS